MDPLIKLAAIAEQMPAPKAPVLVGADPNVFHCVRCNKPQPIASLQHHWTGILHASDAICPECAALTPKHALVACLGCKAIVARMAPERLKSGFMIESRKIYHTECCPNCRPGVERSSIIEAMQFRNR